MICFYFTSKERRLFNSSWPVSYFLPVITRFTSNLTFYWLLHMERVCYLPLSGVQLRIPKFFVAVTFIAAAASTEKLLLFSLVVLLLDRYRDLRRWMVFDPAVVMRISLHDCSPFGGHDRSIPSSSWVTLVFIYSGRKVRTHGYNVSPVITMNSIVMDELFGPVFHQQSCAPVYLVGFSEFFTRTFPSAMFDEAFLGGGGCWLLHSGWMINFVHPSRWTGYWKCFQSTKWRLWPCTDTSVP